MPTKIMVQIREIDQQSPVFPEHAWRMARGRCGIEEKIDRVAGEHGRQRIEEICQRVSGWAATHLSSSSC